MVSGLATSSTARDLPVLLSLRRSRIPFALRLRTAGLRSNIPDVEGLRTCEDDEFSAANGTTTLSCAVRSRPAPFVSM
jgi:hypothetical protein